MNMNLRELYLADNKLNGLQDSAQLGNLLKFNYNIQILDLRNNHILDSGMLRRYSNGCSLTDAVLILWFLNGLCKPTFPPKDSHKSFDFIEMLSIEYFKCCFSPQGWRMCVRA